MSYQIDIVDQSGKKIATKDLDESVFSDANINADLMYDFIRMQQANARVSIASTKNRGEVRGSTKKLYKQKGNGTWRVGDKKSPLRKKGWVARWPRSNRNFHLDMPKKMRKAALRSALSVKASQSWFLWLESFVVQSPSTKAAVLVLKNLDLKRSILIVTNKSIDVMKSYRNISSVDVVDAAYVSVFDILKAQKVVFIGDALDIVVQWAKKKEKIFS